ncbi:hypothetical protein [Streptantibioticus ferralitis]|uniref:ArsR/SmtB family transcription factor n=1 Tax=Streptantibioticus ferralitis TaxID=236510 RepID=UPI0031DE3CA2
MPGGVRQQAQAVEADDDGGALMARDTERSMEQSACSHQLRLLRNLGPGSGARKGRSVVYALCDDHVAELLDQAVHHIEHLRPRISDASPAPQANTAAPVR